MKVFLFGAGYSCRAFAAANPANAGIVGTTRSPDKFARLRASGVSPVLFDGALDDDVVRELAETTHLIVSTAPDDDGDPVLGAARQTIAGRMPSLRWIAYLSTVGVYGDHDGAWVDEESLCHPVSRRSQMRLEAEAAWQAFAGTINRPLAILRLSGIYGPGRNAFVNLENGTAKRLIKPGQVFNRIHVADIAGALWHLARHETGGVFNVTDDVPAPPQDVVAYAADLMGVVPPPEQAFATAQLSPMARSFYGENKRVSNRKLKDAGYLFRFPDYRSALDGLWRDGRWHGEGAVDGRSRIRPD